MCYPNFSLLRWRVLKATTNSWVMTPVECFYDLHDVKSIFDKNANVARNFAIYCMMDEISIKSKTIFESQFMHIKCKYVLSHSTRKNRVKGCFIEISSIVLNCRLFLFAIQNSKTPSKRNSGCICWPCTVCIDWIILNRS